MLALGLNDLLKVLNVIDLSVELHFLLFLACPRRIRGGVVAIRHLYAREVLLSVNTVGGQLIFRHQVPVHMHGVILLVVQQYLWLVEVLDYLLHFVSAHV